MSAAAKAPAPAPHASSPERIATLRHIAALTRELSSLARAQDHQTLTYLLEMATQEAMALAQQDMQSR